MGAKGLVIGSVTKDNQVDEDLLLKLKGAISNKIEVTYHKASDLTNLVQTYEKLKGLGVNRVLTQGGKGPILENSEVIKELLKCEYMNTLLGGGINVQNVENIIKSLHPSEIHIGTCVRKDKFGPVDGLLVEEFIKRMSYS
mgnify:CR=1 FL=1